MLAEEVLGGSSPHQTEVGEELPEVFREVLVLREMEGMSYKEIADVASVSLGTVMSRLSRARQRLREEFAGVRHSESQDEL